MDENNLLKKKVRKWWDKNPMVYDWYTKGKIVNFEKIDKLVRKKSWFAQDGEKPLFSKIIDYKHLIDKKVLEIGCGTGSITAEFAKQGIDIFSTDIAYSASVSTKKRLKLFKLKGEVVESDAENLPFYDETFEYIWCWGVLHHTPDTKKAIDEIWRVLKPKGRALIMLYNRNSIRYWLHLIFIRGCLQLQLLKLSSQEIANKYTDGSPRGGNPLTKHYNKKEIKQLFKRYKLVDISIFGLKDEILPIFHRYLNVDKIIPNSLAKVILCKFGWFLLINAEKE